MAERDAHEEIRDAILLGIEVESEDRRLRDLVTSITPDQVDWIAAWLASESFSRRPADSLRTEEHPDA